MSIIFQKSWNGEWDRTHVTKSHDPLIYTWIYVSLQTTNPLTDSWVTRKKYTWEEYMKIQFLVQHVRNLKVAIHPNKYKFE